MEYHQRRLCSSIFQCAILSVFMLTVVALPDTVKIAGLFEHSESQVHVAFDRAIKMINDDGSNLLRSRLEGKMKGVTPQDSFRAYKSACDLLKKEIVALFGPRSSANAAVAQDTCDSFQMPLFHTHWPPRSNTDGKSSLSLFPESKLLASAFADYIKVQSWKSFTFIFDDIEDLIRLQEIMQIPVNPANKTRKDILRHVKPDEDFKKLMKDLKRAEENNFVVDLPLDRVKELFVGAASVEMMTEYQNYMLTSLDVHTMDWNEDFIGRTNITAFRLIDPENPKFKRFLDEWIFLDQTSNANDYIPSKQPIETESVLIYDGVNMLTDSIGIMDQNKKIELRYIDCDSSSTWADGGEIASHLKFNKFHGASGEIELNGQGLRTKFKLDLVKVQKKSIIKTDIWDTAKGLRKFDTQEFNKSLEDLIKNKTLRVTGCISEPYIFINQTRKELDGEIQYIGFCIDLLDKLSSYFSFKYTLSIRDDDDYGSFKNGEWHGMIGELLRLEADLAIVDLTMTKERESAVDFTMPFMKLGISILFKKPSPQQTTMFSFLKPLSLEVWFYMATGYLGVSLFLFILARLTPYEWVNPHPCDTENEVVENQFTLLNSFWFTTGSIMQEGSDVLPRAVSTRIVASSWWFFTLIMISSYTANLAAFLTQQRMSSPINSVDDLAKQTTIQYGCKEGGSTQKFFMETDYPIYQRMWSYMENKKDPVVFVKDNDKGIERVKMGNYAYLMESTSIEYETERDCDLMRIGSNLDSKGYGIATPPGSPFRSIISEGILHFQEKQVLKQMKDKWWKEFGKEPGFKCPDDSKASSAEMRVKHVGGVFIVLGIGSCLGIIMLIIEFVVKASKMVERDPIYVMLWQELRLALTCRGSWRPAPKEDEKLGDKLPMVNMM